MKPSEMYRNNMKEAPKETAQIPSEMNDYTNHRSSLMTVPQETLVNVVLALGGSYLTPQEMERLVDDVAVPQTAEGEFYDDTDDIPLEEPAGAVA